MNSLPVERSNYSSRCNLLVIRVRNLAKLPHDHNCNLHSAFDVIRRLCMRTCRFLTELVYCVMYISYIKARKLLQILKLTVAETVCAIGKDDDDDDDFLLLMSA
jgi:hypothetical protein